MLERERKDRIPKGLPSSSKTILENNLQIVREIMEILAVKKSKNV